MIDFTTMTDEQVDALLTSVFAESQRRRVQREAPAQAERIAAEFAAAVEGKPAREYVAGMVIGPGERVIEDGEEYVNVSGAWLSVPPSQYRMGYRLVDAPEGETAPEWAPGQAVAVNDRRTHAGIVYVCIQAHTTQTGWEPPAVPALWTPA